MSFDVLFLSRFNAFCGVSTYTEQLATALLHKRVDVGALSSDFEARGESAPVPCIVGWSEGGGLGDVVDEIVRLDPKIVHIQHEHGIFKSTRSLIRLCGEIHERTNAKVVMTAHTVPRKVSRENDEFLRLICAVDVLVVHSKEGVSAIASYPSQAAIQRIEMIPHGMLSNVARTPREESCLKVGVDASESIFRFLSLGFISNTKRHIAMLQLIGSLISRRAVSPKRIELLIVGKQPDASQNVVWFLRKAAASLGIDKNVKIVEGFVPFEMLPYYYGSSDLAIHMVGPSHHSSSGSIRTDLSHGLPAIATRSEITADLHKGVILVGSIDEMMLHIQRAAQKTGVLDVLREKAREFCAENDWNNIAMRHVGLYESISGSQLFDRREGVRAALFHSSSWLLGGFS